MGTRIAQFVSESLAKIDIGSSQKLPLYIGLIFFVFLLGLVTKELLVMFGTATLTEQDAKVEHDWEFTSHMKNVTILLRDADLGVQAYFVSRNRSYLADSKALRARYDNELRLLKITPSDSAARRENFEAFLAVTNRYLQQVEDEIAEVSSPRVFPHQSLAPMLSRNWENNRALQAIEASIEEEQSTLIHLRESEVRRRYWYIAFFCIAACTLFVALLTLFYRLNRRYSAQLSTRNDVLKTDVSLRVDQLTSLSHHLLAMAEQEKANLARELHDELGSSLMVIRLDLLAVVDKIDHIDSKSAAKLRNALQILQKTYDIKRRIIENLHPTTLEHLGLTAAIRIHSEEVAERSGLNIAVNISEDLADLDPAHAIAIYRIVQESITNTVKYAKAKQMSISLERCTKGLRLRIVDDGVGLPGDVLRKKLKSHGIIGMRERATLLGGTFDIRLNDDGRGTRIDVILPGSGVVKATHLA